MKETRWKSAQQLEALDPKYLPKFYYAKRRFPSHQNAGICMEY
jgi:hypothetical protein